MNIENFLDCQTILANQARPVNFAIRFEADEINNPRPRPAAFCVVLDRSGSMEGEALLAFPFPQYRPGQRELAVAAYRVLANGGRLFLAAPTGIGKTISTLFPAVKALGEGKLERIFYLTARTVGRAIAENALVELRRAGLKLRAVTLTAKEKVCVRDGQALGP